MAAFNVDDIIMGDLINSGGSAKVYKGRNRINGWMYAIKIIDKTVLKSETLENIANETRIALSLQHPHIIRTYHAIEDATHIKIYMELYSGDLLEYILSVGQMSSIDIYVIFSQLISAINYLHNHKNIVHRDIKLENILFNNTSDVNVVLIDFGFSMHREPNGPLITKHSGTIEYAAPEVLNGRAYQGYPADIYSLGVVLFTMTFGRFPSPAERGGNIREQIDDQPLRDLISSMLNPVESKRITVREILNHPWIRKCEKKLDSERYMYHDS